MICPVDRTAMLALEWEEIEVDYCAACGGLWLDAGELELLLGADAEAYGLGRFDPATGLSEKPRRCPICRARMTKHRPPGVDTVVFDACPHGHGLWLDRGELDAFTRTAAADAPAGEVARFLAAMFDGAPQGKEQP